jgi:hypothetical protein
MTIISMLRDISRDISTSKSAREVNIAYEMLQTFDVAILTIVSSVN